MTNIYYLTIPKGQESRSELARKFWPRVPHEVAIKLLAKTKICEDLSGLEDTQR